MTVDPVCPAFGCVEIVGFEMVGAKVVLLGRSATAFERDPSSFLLSVSGEIVVEYIDNRQGAQWNHCFNGAGSVAPGEIGHCTFDLPTWAAVTGVNLSPMEHGEVASLGNYLIVPVDVSNPQVRRLGEPWRIEQIELITNIDASREAGWNVYHYDTLSTTQAGNGAAFIGGARTFLRAANRRSV